MYWFVCLDCALEFVAPRDETHCARCQTESIVIRQCNY